MYSIWKIILFIKTRKTAPRYTHTLSKSWADKYQRSITREETTLWLTDLSEAPYDLQTAFQLTCSYSIKNREKPTIQQLERLKQARNTEQLLNAIHTTELCIWPLKVAYKIKRIKTIVHTHHILYKIILFFSLLKNNNKKYVFIRQLKKNNNKLQVYLIYTLRYHLLILNKIKYPALTNISILIGIKVILLND